MFYPPDIVCLVEVIISAAIRHNKCSMSQLAHDKCHDLGKIGEVPAVFRKNKRQGQIPCLLADICIEISYQVTVPHLPQLHCQKCQAIHYCRYLSYKHSNGRLSE